MENIGFKNFRRFKYLEPLDLGEITFMVGRNNAGKSTLVKAILLIIDYIKNRQAGIFRFDGNVLNEANVVSFKRTLCQQADNDSIEFYFRIRNFDCILVVTGNENDTVAKVVSLSLQSSIKGIELSFNFTGRTLVTINREFDDDYEEDESLKTANKELIFLQQELSTIDQKTDLRNWLSKNDEITALQKRISGYKRINPVSTKDYSISYSLSHSGSEIASLDELLNQVYRLNRVRKNDNKTPRTELAAIRSLLNDEATIANELDVFLYHVNRMNLTYFGADSQKQTALLSIKDKSNSLAQAVHNFYQLKLSSNHEKDKKVIDFVQYWMDQFEIGKDYEIISYEGEAYQLLIKDEVDNPKLKINIADKGMGSIQAMKLILQLASVIHNEENGHTERLIIIEEPEINLHPSLQSKLAKLVYEVNYQYAIRFLIETHSEYILRKSQLLVKELNSNDDKKEQPFTVYYFDKEKGPYQMNYRQDGIFQENFGTGFFDVASQHAVQLLKRR
ncbi:AAA family ATPase [Maribellus sp. YY47]|uniref:AAA family ATPase n=1 Tax=Maribellus sp. YY47 TaxID=2929486 RepID=UPI00200066C4|nr:AAA family ATPase [Maribellus sp. YY47]MCK3686168.1 ATP-binding protein [Maribellus sp. YY47]